TTIRVVCGMLRADSGMVSVQGQQVDHRASAAKASIGFVPQDVALYPDLSAAENLCFFGHLYKLRGRVLAERVDEVLDPVGLGDRSADRVDSFSGGCAGASTSAPPCCTIRGYWSSTSRRWASTPRAGTPSLTASSGSASPAWPTSAPPTTWKRPSTSATGLGSSIAAGS